MTVGSNTMPNLRDRLSNQATVNMQGIGLAYERTRLGDTNCEQKEGDDCQSQSVISKFISILGQFCSVRGDGLFTLLICCVVAYGTRCLFVTASIVDHGTGRAVAFGGACFVCMLLALVCLKIWFSMA
jgi:hypothetical protein